MKPGSLLVVHLVEKRSVGFTFERKRTEWPLHITLVPWFESPDEAAIEAAIIKSLYPMLPFAVSVGAEASFGPDGDVPVNVIAKQDKIRQLHTALLEAIIEVGGKFMTSSRWVGEDFAAHITHHGGLRKQPGDVELVDDVALVRYSAPNNCTIVKSFLLGAS